ARHAGKPTQSDHSTLSVYGSERTDVTLAFSWRYSVHDRNSSPLIHFRARIWQLWPPSIRITRPTGRTTTVAARRVRAATVSLRVRAKGGFACCAPGVSE